jgi:hypothetical protein
MKTVSVSILIIATILLTFSASLNLSFAQTFTSDIDAAFLSDVDNKLYLLKGDQYVRLSFVVGEGATMDEGYPQPIADWTGLPANFTSDIDAAFLSDVDNKLYLLKGDQYVRLSFVVGEGATMDEGYPQPIADWTGLPG